MRNMIRKSAPTRARVARTISSGKRRRFASEPPYWSLRLLVRSAVNWLIR